MSNSGSFVHPDEQNVDEPVQLDRGLGSGSLSYSEAKIENDSPVASNDGRYDTRTTFWPWDSAEDGPSQLDRDPGDRRSWDKLSQWNDGVGDPDRRVDNFKADTRRWVDTVCSVLNCNSYQKRRSSYIVKKIVNTNNDYPTLTKISPNLCTEAIILCIVSLVIDTTVDANPNGWDFDDWVVNRDEFEDMRSAFDMSRNQMWDCRTQLQSETDFFEVT